MGFASYRFEVQYVKHHSGAHLSIDSLYMTEYRYYPEFYLAEVGNLVYYSGRLIFAVCGDI